MLQTSNFAQKVTPSKLQTSASKVENHTGCQLSTEQLSMLEKIAKLADGSVRIDEVAYQGDTSWVRFHIPGQFDSNVLKMLDVQEYELFGPGERFRWQIVCPSDPSSEGSGLWLHELNTASARNEYKCGCWFY